MKTIHHIEEMQNLSRQHRSEGKTIGFVPTMGNLHAGHIKLAREAGKICDIVVASVFVNPMQFGENEDLDKYPRTLELDQEKLSAVDTDFLFAPSAREMYPSGLDKHLKMNMPHMAQVLCGKSRPTHFEGVCTVVAKLFSIVAPNAAVFGKKDLQQLLIVKQMTADLCLGIDIVGVDTEREENGLALSSRNSLLSLEEKSHATVISQQLEEVRKAISPGNLAYRELESNASKVISESVLKTDYFEIRELSGFDLAEEGSAYDNLGIFAAAYAANTRLIDNTTLAPI